MARIRLRSGDVLEVGTDKGLAYIQYVGEHPKYGEVIGVLPGLFEQRSVDLGLLVSNTAYIAFYPARLAVAEGLATVVDRQAVPPGGGVPSRLRRAGMISRGGEVETWIIDNGDRQVLRRALDEEEARLPRGMIWNHQMLIARLAEGWRPELDAGKSEQKDAVGTERPVSEKKGPAEVRHYLYFSNEGSADHVARVLGLRGFETEKRFDPEDRSWLVLVKHHLPRGKSVDAEVEEALVRIAEDNGGEYDGRETEV